MSKGRGQRSNPPRYQGTKVSVVLGRTKLEQTPEGQANRAAPPSREAIRSYIAAGKCPWCARGPWKVLAGHTYRSHGIDRHELRALAGYRREVSICDPAVSEAVKDRRRSDGIVPPPGKRIERPCVICGTILPPRSGRSTCSQVCETKRRSEVGSRPKPKPRGWTGWSKRYEVCVQCQTTDQEHVGKGLCARCHDRARRPAVGRPATPLPNEQAVLEAIEAGLLEVRDGSIWRVRKRTRVGRVVEIEPQLAQRIENGALRVYIWTDDGQKSATVSRILDFAHLAAL